LQGHVDVVTTADQEWDHDPFGGELIDGYVWGRGALDMKGGVAMLVAAFLRAKVKAADLPGDVILNILADEESGSDFGAKFLVEEHPEQFDGVKYALGEFGGFSLHLGGREFFPIMIAEKHRCGIQLTTKGPEGHGSMPVHGGAMAKMGKILSKLDQTPLPVHITPPARQMFAALAEATRFPTSLILRLLMNPLLTNRVLKLLGERGRVFRPLLQNTVSPTIVNGGGTFNVIPGKVVLQLDGRILPGLEPETMLEELSKLLGDEVEEMKLTHCDLGPPEADMGMFPTLAGILREMNPQGVPVPLLLAGGTDARFFARLGIQTYGFLPMPLPKGFKFSETVHAANERVPAAAIDFGTDAIYQGLCCFHG
jgi:acetylornithine deacetylase/succinyl-diaminopimelate desuccinylase-like protein